MNIIEFLKKDHQKYGRELTKMRRGLQEVGLAEKITNLISHCELHESVEYRIYSVLNGFPKQEIRCDWILNYKANHERMWELLEKLKNSMWTENILLIQNAFFDFHDFLERHMRTQQLSLFPIMQTVLSNHMRQDLGGRAEKHYLRFLSPSL